MPLVGGFSRGSPVSPALSFRRCSILTSITIISSQDLDPRENPSTSGIVRHDSHLRKSGGVTLQWKTRQLSAVAARVTIVWYVFVSLRAGNHTWGSGCAVSWLLIPQRGSLTFFLVREFKARLPCMGFSLPLSAKSWLLGHCRFPSRRFGSHRSLHLSGRSSSSNYRIAAITRQGNSYCCCYLALKLEAAMSSEAPGRKTTCVWARVSLIAGKCGRRLREWAYCPASGDTCGPGCAHCWLECFFCSPDAVSAYNTCQKAKLNYRNRIRLERASQTQSSDTHKTSYDRVKRCRERKKFIKVSERVNTRSMTCVSDFGLGVRSRPTGTATCGRWYNVTVARPSHPLAAVHVRSRPGCVTRRSSFFAAERRFQFASSPIAARGSNERLRAWEGSLVAGRVELGSQLKSNSNAFGNAGKILMGRKSSKTVALVRLASVFTMAYFQEVGKKQADSKLLTSQLGEPGFLHVGIVPDDAAGRWVVSDISCFLRSFIPAATLSVFPETIGADSFSQLAGSSGRAGGGLVPGQLPLDNYG
ncbi:hypothetical protein PR048_001187 [Dryococelus australis]|uniref:Uncharacterized protein n=1 Tax=Dryococelus australis TaxID=614101 RepID=A0ABQ9IGN7_9NEOP|nr:hypothetical protein PR048_001187 [Dryococelus australis]